MIPGKVSKWGKDKVVRIPNKYKDELKVGEYVMIEPAGFVKASELKEAK
jgi:antitoxin component of MazEF toxin-antitoxin module